MKTIIISDWYNALYEDGLLKVDAKPDYLHGETMITLFPDAEAYYVEYNLYDEIIGNNDGYPFRLSDFPLDRCRKLK